MTRAASAEVRPLKPNQQAARSESAHEIHERLEKSIAGARSVWVFQAEALSDMRACKGWKDLGYENMAEWLTQPEVSMSTSWARKLAGMFDAFMERKADRDRMAKCDPSNLAITVRAVREGEVTWKRAISDCLSMSREELEVRYSEDLDGSLDADAEPEKWQCPHCHKIHARQPAHLREDDGDEDPEGDHYPAAGVDDDGAVF